MKIRFEIELPWAEIEESPSEQYWQRFSDKDIESVLEDAAVCDLEHLSKVTINQDDLKEFIKQVRANTKETKNG